MVRNTTAEGVRNADATAKRSCPMADQRRRQEPTLRLIGVRPMTNEEQRRFDLLLQSLLRHWVERGGSKEGNHESQIAE